MRVSHFVLVHVRAFRSLKPALRAFQVFGGTPSTDTVLAVLFRTTVRAERNAHIQVIAESSTYPSETP